MNNNTTGWVKLHRKLINWEHYKKPNVRAVFMHLIFVANYEDTTFKDGIEIKRGQQIITLNSLASALGITIAAVRHALRILQQSGEVKVLTHKRYTLITVNKYSTFQGENSDENSNTTNDRMNNTTTSNNNNSNNSSNRITVKGLYTTDFKNHSKSNNMTNNTNKNPTCSTNNDTTCDTPFIRNKEDKEVKEDKEIKNTLTQQNSETTPEVVASVTDNFKNLSNPVNTPPEGKEKKKVARKRKETRVLLAKGANYLPKTSKENNYVNYAIYFHMLLEPVHGGKFAFDKADAYKWAKDIRTILEKHKRDLKQLFELVKWAVDNSDDTMVYMQSPYFLAKNNGINYDRLLAKREFEQKKVDRLNGKAPTKISTPKYYN